MGSYHFISGGERGCARARMFDGSGSKEVGRPGS